MELRTRIFFPYPQGPLSLSHFAARNLSEYILTAPQDIDNLPLMKLPATGIFSPDSFPSIRGTQCIQESAKGV
jgi:hypothetical protein